ncbi:flagellar motor switch protein [Tabrizicola sp. WMC-M-20]|nr:flagellar motor switch protein [Tabrizicola sp. WMC-M-20]
MASLVIDGVVIVLLLGAIAYGTILSRRVERLMEALREMEPRVQEFSEAVDRSERSVGALHQAAQAVPALAEAPDGGAKTATRPNVRDGRTRVVVPGSKMLSGKTDLVKGFFETTRSRAT